MKPEILLAHRAWSFGGLLAVAVLALPGAAGPDGSASSRRTDNGSDGLSFAFDIHAHFVKSDALSVVSVIPRVTARVSIDSASNQANNDNREPTISNDGRFVAFTSSASNLVVGDSNDSDDIFVHDRLTGVTTRVSLNSAGNQANGDSSLAAISGAGRFVAFVSSASNLVARDTNDDDDIFVHDCQTGVTTRVSISSTGSQGNGRSFLPAISPEGRFVVFWSQANNLVMGDTNDRTDVFFHDRRTGATTRVSIDSAGSQANGDSGDPVTSADGRFVAFDSFATNLVTGDTNGWEDIFVHDRLTGTTTRMNVDSTGSQANAPSQGPAISGDGRFVAFYTYASNLVAGDTNGGYDVFVHDRQTGATTRVSVDSAGSQANSNSFFPTFSDDGRFVAFRSGASNLVAGDTNGLDDIFVHDRQTGVTSRVNVDSAGSQANGATFNAAISGDGRFVAFESFATNLVAGDTNLEKDIFVNGVGCDGRLATIVGSEAYDILIGTPGDDVIAGLGGNDGIRGLGGDDIICGGRGDDVIEGGARDDKILGDSGNDQLLGQDGADIIIGDGGDDLLDGGSNNDWLTGGDGDDALNGDNGFDTCDGGHGVADTAANCERTAHVP